MNYVISAWADLSGDCPIRSVVSSGNHASIIYGGGSAVGELDLDRRAVRMLATLTADALVEMDERAERGEVS